MIARTGLQETIQNAWNKADRIEGINRIFVLKSSYRVLFEINYCKGPILNLPNFAGWEDLAGTTEETGRLGQWSQAFITWLEGLHTNYCQSVWEEAQHAWKDFNTSIHKLPWEITPDDVTGYLDRLQKDGRKASTVRIRLMNLRRFYDYCIHNGVDEGLTANENPFNQVELPKVCSYAKPTYISPADERKLLRTIQRDPSATGQRDYALFQMLLNTGRSAGEVRKLRWQDLAFDDGQTWLIEATTGNRELLEGVIKLEKTPEAASFLDSLSDKP